MMVRIRSHLEVGSARFLSKRLFSAKHKHSMQRNSFSGEIVVGHAVKERIRMHAFRFVS